MSSELAEKLMQAPSAMAFVQEQQIAADWRTISALKTEVDRLVGCDLGAAANLTTRIEELAVITGDRIAIAFAAASRARVCHHAGEYARANVFYERAASAMRAAKLLTEAACVQKHQVDALTQLGMYDEAFRTARAVRRVLQQSDPLQVAQLETNIGNIYYRLDRYHQALKYYDRAYKVLSAAGEEAMCAAVDGNRSNILLELDRHDEALELLQRATASFERTGRQVLAAETGFHIAYLQFLRGNYHTALATYHQVRDRLNELGSPHRVAWCNQEMAEVLLALNSFDDAAESAAAAQRSFSQLGMPYESAQSRMTQALALGGLRQLDEAANQLSVARGVFAQSDNKILTAMADMYLAELALRRSDVDEAMKRASAALSIFKRQNLSTRTAYSQLIVARAAYQSGNLTRALRIAKSTLSDVEGMFATTVTYQCQHLLGHIHRDRQRGREALNWFRRAVETVEKMRGGIAVDEYKVSFLRDKVEVYEDAIAACLDHGGDELVEEAFRLVESSKSRALADMMARYARQDLGSETRGALRRIKPETRARLLKLIEDLNWYNSQAGREDGERNQRSIALADHYRSASASCEKRIAQIFRRMEHEAPDFVDIHRMKVAGADDLRQALQAGETAIEYFTTGDKLSAFVATRDHITVARGIGSKAEVERVLTALRFQLEKFNYGSDYVEAYFGQLKHAVDAHLKQMYQLVIAPLERLLTEPNLVIIPHGPLHYVPFHALHDGEKYLVDRFSTSYAPSAAVLKICRARHKQSGQPSDKALVALGVVEKNMPSTETEVKTLASLFPRSVKLLGKDATRANLMRYAPQAQFLHLASHGHFRRDNPMFSFLKLADAPLNFYSLLDMELNAEMVTLSACHTGVNRVFPGDELHGLMRGFLYAGTPSLVASLWAVNDHSTTELMREMYSRIRAGASKRDALRQAQLAIKDAYGHPYYWAPFILMGNPL